jgi:hypothetical protein
MLVVILLVMLIRLWFRKQQNCADETNDCRREERLSPLHQKSSPNTSDLQSPAWSGYKSELPGDENGIRNSPTYVQYRNDKSEVEGSPAMGGGARPISNGGFELPGRKGTVYEMPG